MHYIRTIAVGLLPFLLIGCGLMARTPNIENRNDNYLSAKSAAPLNIPPGISSGAISSQYPISGTYYPDATKKVDLTPPGLMGSQ